MVDDDIKVLKACRLLAKLLAPRRQINLSKLNVIESKIEGVYKLIVMVNWIHNLEPFVLKKTLENLYFNNLENEGLLFFDVVSNHEYKYNHYE